MACRVATGWRRGRAFSKSHQGFEDGGRVAADPFGAGGERSGPRPERGLPAQQVERGGTQEAHRGARGVRLQHMAVLAEGVVPDVEEPVLDAPVAAAQRQHPLRAGLRGVEAGDQIAQARTDLARGLSGHLRPHFGHLCQAREQAVRGERP
jgi:hypothetical protein